MKEGVFSVYQQDGDDAGSRQDGGMETGINLSLRYLTETITGFKQVQSGDL